MFNFFIDNVIVVGKCKISRRDFNPHVEDEKLVQKRLSVLIKRLVKNKVHENVVIQVKSMNRL